MANEQRATSEWRAGEADTPVAAGFSLPSEEGRLKPAPPNSADEGTVPPDYFEAMYRADPDPWRFATSDYEREKYAATLAALPRPCYRAAFEIGCSVGVLTRQLAGRCDALLAVDGAALALEAARARCADQSHVRFARMQVPDAFPTETFDLILLSEVGYYLSPGNLTRARTRIVSHLEPGGHLLLVHWTPRIAECALDGDAVHRQFEEWEGTRLQHHIGQRAATYRLDLWERLPDR